MSFGWSASDLVAALTVINKIRVALKDSGGASSNYQEESGFLQSLSRTLETLSSLQSAPLAQDALGDIQDICRQIQDPLRAFAEQVDRDFETKLGPQFASKNRFSKLVRSPQMVQWALYTSKRVTQLKARIVVPLMALQIAMSQQSINLALRLSHETRTGVVQDISKTFDERIQPWTEDVQYRLSTLLAKQSALCHCNEANFKKLAEAYLKASDVLRTDEKGVAAILRNFTSLDKKLDVMLDAMDRLGCPDRMGTSVEISKSRSHNLDLSVASTSMALRNGLSLHSVPAVKDSSVAKQDLSRAIKLLFSSIQILMLEYIYTIVTLLATRYRTLVQGFSSHLIQRPLPVSLENGIIFEDALGRSSFLSCNYLRSWEMFTGVLRLWFRGLPGEDNVRAGMFYILNARRGSRTITPTTWCQAVTQGEHLQMYMMVESQSIEDMPCLACERQSNRPPVRTAFCTCRCRQPEGINVRSLLVRRLCKVMACPLAINMMDRPVAIQDGLPDMIKNSEEEISAFRRINLLL